MGQRQWILERDFESPLGDKSAFHNVFIDLEGNTYPNDSTPAKYKYTYKIIDFDSGVDVFRALKDDEYKPDARHMFIFVEKDEESRNNFFGTACRVKMGSEWKALAKQLKYKQKKASVNDSQSLARTLAELAEDIIFHSRHKQLTKDILLSALELEISDVANYNGILKDLFGLNNKLADWIYKGAESIESWKFTKENYEFTRVNYSRDIKPYKPIIPVPFEVVKQDFSDKETRVAQEKFSNVVAFFDNIEQVIFDPKNLVLSAAVLPGNPILKAGATATGLVAIAYLEENLPDDIRKVFNKIKAIVTKVKNFS